jgi:hypothetical protein
MESNEIDVLSLAVFCDFEQRVQVREARLAHQFRSDIGEIDGFYRVDFDLSLFHGITPAHLHMRVHPDSDAAPDIAAADSLAKPLVEYHEKILPLAYAKEEGL